MSLGLPVMVTVLQYCAEARVVCLFPARNGSTGARLPNVIKKAKSL
jgi:hypothetical protein